MIPMTRPQSRLRSMGLWVRLERFHKCLYDLDFAPDALCQILLLGKVASRLRQGVGESLDTFEATHDLSAVWGNSHGS